MRSGRITLYLSKFSDKEWAATKVLTGGNVSHSHRWKITNWPGSLVIQPYGVKTAKGRGWYGCTYSIEDVWFVGPDGYEWYGRCQGDNEILHCRRLKKQSLSFGGVVWRTAAGKEIPIYQMEPAHLQNIISKINRDLKSRSRKLREWAKIHYAYIQPMQKILDIKRRRGDPERFGEDVEFDQTLYAESMGKFAQQVTQ